VEGFRAMDGSGAFKHPSGATIGGFVVLTEKHNQFILSMQQKMDNIKGNIANLESAADGIQQSAENVTVQINDYHNALIGILNQQKEKSLAKLELKECTDYKFRILVKASDYKIYSKTLAIKTPEFKRLNSAMITAKEKKQLLNWIVDKKANKFELLFKGSRDGFDSQKFHQKCDGQGPTITIVKSDYQDHIFGGYTSISWHHTGNYTQDNNAWLYSLRNAKGTPKKI